MAHAPALPRPAQSDVPVRGQPERIPWYVWNFLAAGISVTIGGIWDISWHVSIGRDTFWTPAHLLIYLCGILGGVGSAVLILGTTWNARSPLRDTSVRVWGFRGPLGAFVAAWGGVAMLVSAPFDDWWHNAYGLDVKVLSPPHVVLILGILAIKLGGLLLILGEMNRANEALRRKLMPIFLFLGTLLARDFVGIFSLEYLQRSQMHTARYYLVVMLTFPIGHFAVARAAGIRWGLTATAAIGTVISLLFLWILPLFPAEPKLGPVYREITHFIPMGGFPMMILPACFVTDWLWQRRRDWPDWRLAALLGPTLLITFLAVQWPLADFLQSPGARNWFFGSHYLPFFTHPESDAARFVFTQVEAGMAQFWTRLAMAGVAAILSTRLGLALGSWMKTIKR
jgi:hypothetical protein